MTALRARLAAWWADRWVARVRYDELERAYRTSLVRGRELSNELEQALRRSARL